MLRERRKARRGARRGGVRGAWRGKPLRSVGRKPRREFHPLRCSCFRKSQADSRGFLPTLARFSLAMRLAHRPGALLASLAPFAKHAVNLLKIESRPHPRPPWEYQFFMDVEAGDGARLDLALAEVRSGHQRTPRPRPLRGCMCFLRYKHCSFQFPFSNVIHFSFLFNERRQTTVNRIPDRPKN